MIFFWGGGRGKKYKRIPSTGPHRFDDVCTAKKLQMSFFFVIFKQRPNSDLIQRELEQCKDGSFCIIFFLWHTRCVRMGRGRAGTCWCVVRTGAIFSSSSSLFFKSKACLAPIFFLGQKEAFQGPVFCSLHLMLMRGEKEEEEEEEEEHVC